ncbi:hypothetical protein BZA70DRAFT_276079 [Myxozyma melibiosi]|uniref:DUF8040 domain-containing protein n=1 Tax=Myxozyma melibiosi TaxID=54550 RepID=A0ABR1FAZ1_9ASCO
MTATRVNASIDSDIIDSDYGSDDSYTESDSDSDDDLNDLICMTIIALIEEQRQEQERYDQELDEDLTVMSAVIAVLREYIATNGRFDRSVRSSELRGAAYVEDVLDAERDDFHEITRMEKDAFSDLVGRLEREGLRSTKNMDNAEMLLIFLSVFGSGWSVGMVAERYRRRVGTVHDVVHAVLLAMAEIPKTEITLPSLTPSDRYPNLSSDLRTHPPHRTLALCPLCSSPSSSGADSLAS